VKQEQYKYSTVDLDFDKVENMLKADNVERKKPFDINSIDVGFDM
jgi:hypothetical protein